MRFGYPAEVRQALAQILEIACLAIRVAARNGDAQYCAIEANHVHNLPSLLRTFEPRKLKYYLDVTRAQYVEALGQFPGATADPYKALWARLERYVA
jgi:hypothetical protein